jgi:hypothetical protein
MSYLEGKVLEEVRGSVRPVCLCAATSIDPYTDGRSLGPRRVLGSDLRHRVNWCPDSSASVQPTVKPFLRVVDSVFAPYVTGVASPRVKGDAFEALTALMAARERMPCCRLSASRREAIVSARRAGADGRCGGDGGGMGYVELQLGYVGVDEVRNLPSRDVPGPAASQWEAREGQLVRSEALVDVESDSDIDVLHLDTTSPPSICTWKTAQWHPSCVRAFSGKQSRRPPPRSACCRPSRAPPSARLPSRCDQLSSAPPSPPRHALQPSMLPSATRSCLLCPRRSLAPPMTPHLSRTQTTPTEATTGVLRGGSILHEKKERGSEEKSLQRNRSNWYLEHG